MFVQQKKMTYLNLPAKHLRRLYASTVDVQLALPDFPAQMSSAYLVALSSGKNIQVLLGLYLVKSGRSVIFLPQAGEVAADKADTVLQGGLEFAESMGFVLADADIHKLSPDKLEAFWHDLPICTKPAAVKPSAQKRAAQPIASGTDKVAGEEANKAADQVPLEERRRLCKESLGRFLASL